MTTKLLLIGALATCSAAADATIYRCADTNAKAPPAFLRVEDKHIGLSRAPEQDGWADLCTRPGESCGTDKHGRFHANFFAVDAGDNLQFDPAKLQLVREQNSALFPRLTERTHYDCKPLTPGEEAALAKPWQTWAGP